MCVHREHRTGNCRVCDADFRATLERSSLGTPAAKAARESVSDEDAARVVARSNELRAMPDRWDGDDG